MRTIFITVGSINARAELNDSPTATAIWEALPIEARAATWGDEVYFGIPVIEAEGKDARDVLAMGELGYWPPGQAFCIFFGPTPASQGNEIRSASAVNPIGRVVDDPKVFRIVHDGETIVLSRAAE